MDVKKILKELTVDEKLRLLGGDGDWHTYDCNGKMPSIMMTDGPHGLRKVEQEKRGDIEGSNPATCFPTASAVACGWNPKLTNLMGQAIACEAKKEKVSIVLGCGINIKRSPLCGRNFEYYSEDPFLTGKLATEYINGVQSKGIGTSLKHFAANSQETRRMTSNSEVDERALREIYLAAFEEVVKKAKPTTLMCSYNRINGKYASWNRHLLTEILRDEWGYDGAVISDWGATNHVVDCFKAGLNLEMPDPKGYHTSVLKKAYESGEITMEEIDSWAGKVIEKLVSLHENVEDDFSVDYAAHNIVAKNIENECAVLLKNEGALPVSKDKTLIVVGELAEKMRFQGGGSSHINPVSHKNAIEALRDEGYNVIYSKGYSNDTDEPDEKLVGEALKCIRENYRRKNSVILYFLGLTDSFEGEGYDRSTMDIPYNQTDLLERIDGVADYENIVAVSFGGAPMEFSWESHVSSILHMYLGGQAVGESVAELVSGKVNPSGKLAETMPFSVTDTPAWRYYALPFDDVEYRESIYVGYRYYETFGVPVRYPFGYGLSYTTFEYSNMTLPEVYESGEISATVTVKNTGNHAGAEIVELYVLPEKENFLRSSVELKGFAKVFLEPGEEKEVTVKLDERSFAVYDVDKFSFATIGGVYTVAFGASVKDLREKRNIVVNGGRYSRNERELAPDYFKAQPHGMEIERSQFETLYGAPLTDFRNRKRGDYDENCSFYDVTSKSLAGLTVRGITNLGIKIMFPGKKKTDPSYIMMKKGVEEGNLEGLIANSGGIIGPGLVKFLVNCANFGHKRKR